MPFAKNADIRGLLNLPSVRNYFENTNIMNKSTSEQYLSRLRIFNNFFIKEFNGLTIEMNLSKN